MTGLREQIRSKIAGAIPAVPLTPEAEKRQRWHHILQQAASLRALADNLVGMIATEVRDSPAAEPVEDSACPTGHRDAVEVTTMGSDNRRYVCPDCNQIIER